MKSIRFSTTLFTVASTVAILTVGLLVIDRVLSNWLENQFDDALHSKAQALVTLSKSNGEQIEMDFADEFMPEFSRLGNPEYFELYLQNGELLERSRSYDNRPPMVFDNPADDVEIKNVALPNGRSGRQISIRFIPQIEDLTLRSKYPEKSREKAVIFLSRERAPLDDLLFKFHFLISGIGLLVVVSISFTVTKSVKAGLVPLVNIANDIRRITPESINIPINTRNQPTELVSIATQFNLVLTEIENAMLRERQFSSDVAHELRTPVSEMRALAEVGLRWPEEKETSSYFSDIYESSRHLDQLVSNLLHLSRCEEGRIDVEISEVRFDQLITNVCSKLDFESQAKNISFKFSSHKSPVLLVDANWLELMLFNLIANAIAYSPRDVTVEIVISSHNDRCMIEIKNPMLEPLVADDINHIFERFWRKDSARTTGNHVGIGLALVKSYTEYLNLEVEAHISDEQVFCISISNIKIVY